MTWTIVDVLLGHSTFCFRLYVTSGSSHDVRIKCVVCKQLSIMSEFCDVKGIHTAAWQNLLEAQRTHLTGSGFHD